jgi:hypothetical protein
MKNVVENPWQFGVQKLLSMTPEQSGQSTADVRKLLSTVVSSWAGGGGGAKISQGNQADHSGSFLPLGGGVISSCRLSFQKNLMDSLVRLANHFLSR